MQYILEEKEYEQLIKWQKVQNALDDLDKDLRPIFQKFGGWRHNSLGMSFSFEKTPEFEDYKAAFEKFAKNL